MLRRTLIAAIFGAALLPFAHADDKTIKLASLDWPPYSGAKLPQQGASVAVAKAAFEAMGYKLVVEFFPWSRAVENGKSDPAFAGYFPEYDSADLRKTFTVSDPMGEGPLGLAQRKEAAISWNTIADLAKYKIGVVQDYINTEEFDAAVAAKKQKVDVAIDDSRNLLKLGAGRIDAAIVDSNVFQYLMKTDPQLKPFVGKLEMNAKLLENKKIYVAFKKSADGQRIAKIFNDGLKKIDVGAVMHKALGN